DRVGAQVVLRAELARVVDVPARAVPQPAVAAAHGVEDPVHRYRVTGRGARRRLEGGEGVRVGARYPGRRRPAGQLGAHLLQRRSDPRGQLAAVQVVDHLDEIAQQARLELGVARGVRVDQAHLDAAEDE